MKAFLPKFLSITATGLLAGAFMYGLLNVVPTFYEVPVNVHIIYRTRLMNHNGITMQFLMGLSVITPLWYARVCRFAKPAMCFAITASGLALTALLITRFGNVPINTLIKTWVPSHPPANWITLLHTWDRYNLARTIAALGCFLSFSTAVHLSVLEKKA